MREEVFARQAGLLGRIAETQVHLRTQIYKLVVGQEQLRQSASKEVSIHLGELMKLYGESSVLLPMELCTELVGVISQGGELLSLHDNGHPLSDSSFGDMLARSAKLTLLSRTFLGVDQLNNDNLRLLSDPETYAQIATAEIAVFEQMQQSNDVEQRAKGIVQAAR